MENLQCGICLEIIKHEQGRLDCCTHKFCFQCILEWSKVANRCPFCKFKFRSLDRIKVSDQTNTATTTIQIPDANLSASCEDDLNVYSSQDGRELRNTRARQRRFAPNAPHKSSSPFHSNPVYTTTSPSLYQTSITSWSNTSCGPSSSTPTSEFSRLSRHPQSTAQNKDEDYFQNISPLKPQVTPMKRTPHNRTPLRNITNSSNRLFNNNDSNAQSINSSEESSSSSGLNLKSLPDELNSTICRSVQYSFQDKQYLHRWNFATAVKSMLQPLYDAQEIDRPKFKSIVERVTRELMNGCSERDMDKPLPMSPSRKRKIRELLSAELSSEVR